MFHFVIIIYYENFFLSLLFLRVYDVNALSNNNKQNWIFLCAGIVKKNLHISPCAFILDFESNSMQEQRKFEFSSFSILPNFVYVNG